jgi:hypothetical protein
MPEKNELCHAPWGCSNPTAKSSGKGKRSIDDVEICRPCYQYAWEKAKELGKNISEVFYTLPNPHRPLPAIKTKCHRTGCPVTFEKGERNGFRRRIGNFHVCRNCYESAWERSKDKGISIEEAFQMLPPKK